ncbi:MAG: hypothetical protein PUB69_06395 [Desulfovibrionaceae bacterium]|nr:hypothetical protein [Desulfovibrionaceae bacterium]
MSQIDDITIEYEESGQILIQETGKCVLSNTGTWVTILFRFRQLKQDTGEYGPEKFSVRRYNRVGGEYRLKSKFDISSVRQAGKIVSILTQWIQEAESGEETATQ